MYLRNLKFRVRLFSMLFAFCCPAISFADTKVIAKEAMVTVAMSFEKCISRIQGVATDLGVAPINIVETNIIRIVHFPTNDGSRQSMLVTCSRPDQHMLIDFTTP